MKNRPEIPPEFIPIMNFTADVFYKKLISIDRSKDAGILFHQLKPEIAHATEEELRRFSLLYSEFVIFLKTKRNPKNQEEEKKVIEDAIQMAWELYNDEKE